MWVKAAMKCPQVRNVPFLLLVYTAPRLLQIFELGDGAIPLGIRSDRLTFMVSKEEWSF